MSLRTAFLVAACTVFLAGRVFGLHSHLSHDPHDDHGQAGQVAAFEHDSHDEGHELDHDHEPEGHTGHITVPGAEGAAGHLEAHLHGGDVDLDQPATSASKGSLFSVLVWAGGFDSTPGLIIPASESLAFPPPSPPPKPGSRPYLHPPSQAPPRAVLNG